MVALKIHMARQVSREEKHDKTDSYLANDMKTPRARLLRIVVVVSVFLVVLAGLALGAMAFWANTPIRMQGSPVELTVKAGDGLGQTIAAVHAAGIQVSPAPLKLLARQMAVGKRIKPGAYLFQDPLTPRSLLTRLERGDVIQVDFGFPEGWTFRQIRERLNAHPGLRHDTLGASDAEIMRLIGAEGAMPEGLFFPDTYRADKGASDIVVLRAAYLAMKAQIDEAWRNRDPATPLRTPNEALILASIVEKESGRPEDRPLVASVFANRLRIGMRLQTDPTVIYGLGESFDGNLRKRDLLADTPYNTYTRAGLPPGPISMPGRDSLMAAARPPASKMLYFVARGDGSSEFSPSLEAHNRAVNKYQLGGR